MVCTGTAPPSLAMSVVASITMRPSTHCRPIFGTAARLPCAIGPKAAAPVRKRTPQASRSNAPLASRGAPCRHGACLPLRSRAGTPRMPCAGAAPHRGHPASAAKPAAARGGARNPLALPLLAAAGEARAHQVPAVRGLGRCVGGAPGA